MQLSTAHMNHDSTSASVDDAVFLVVLHLSNCCFGLQGRLTINKVKIESFNACQLYEV